MGTTTEHVLVKWQTPADEAIGVARLAHALVERGACEAGRMCIAAPNAGWAHQMRRACEAVGQKALVCIGAPRLDAPSERALARLALLADPDGGDARGKWRALGLGGDGDAAEFAATYSEARGFTLLRATGIAGLAAFEVGLLHVQGDEDAPALHRLLVEQLADPAPPPGAEHVPIRHYRRLDGDYAHVFLVGCVDGLVPEGRLYRADGRAACEDPLAVSRDAFLHAYDLASVRTVVSGFSKAEADMAGAAGIRSSRTRVDDGRAYATCRPTPFIAELGMDAPATVGGQALLALYGLH